MVAVHKSDRRRLGHDGHNEVVRGVMRALSMRSRFKRSLAG